MRWQKVLECKNYRYEFRFKLGTTKQPVFAILARSGRVFAKIISDVEAKDLIPIIENKVKKDSTICSDTWRAYTELATRGYVHFKG